MGDFERYSFKASWYQKEADLCRSFIINFYPKDNSVDIFDQKSRKMFLRRSPLDTLGQLRLECSTPKQFYVGAKLNIFGRLFNITEYADDFTKLKLSSHRESTFCLLKPDAISLMDKILNRFRDEHLTIGHCKMVQLSSDAAHQLLMEENGDITPNVTALIESITSEPVVVMELFGQNAILKLLDIVGPDDPDEAKELFPNSIRAKYGLNLVKNLIFCSTSVVSAEKNIQYFFTGDTVEPHVTMNGAMCIVKPHALLEGKLGDIISVIYENHLKITAMKMLHFDRKSSEEFLEIYKGVVPEYNKMVLELISGPSIGMEIMSCDSKVDSYSKLQSHLRDICGPMDPAIAQKIRPRSIRAKFGVNTVQNAIHCTDLCEDTELELNRFFKIYK